MPKIISKTAKSVQGKSRAAAPSLPYEDSLIESLKDRDEATAYQEAAIEDGDQAVLMLALRHVAQAKGGVAEMKKAGSESNSNSTLS